MIEFGMLNGSTGKHFASYCLKPFWGQAKGPTIGFPKPPSRPLSEGDLGPPWSTPSTWRTQARGPSKSCAS